MAFLLLVTLDPRAEELRELLAAQGWWVSLVRDREAALRSAADQEPRVVIVDSEVAGARELVKAFSSRNGGPGSVVLGRPDDQHGNLALVEAGADELLSATPRLEELARAIERVAATPHQATVTGPLLVGRQLTADDIFGDILAEVEGPDSASSGERRRERGQWDSEPSWEAGSELYGAVSEPPAEPASESAVEPVAAAEPWKENGHTLEPPAEATDGETAEPERREEEEEPVESIEGADEQIAAGSSSMEGASEQIASDSLSMEGPAEQIATGSPGESEAEELEPGDDGSGLGQYELEERIAVGGMAEVWRASMVGLEGFRKTVAIKKILPHLAENEEFVHMFVDEAKLAAQLSHENLVEIYDLGKMGKDFFIAMELVDGRDLRSVLDRVRRRGEEFPLELALYIAAKTAAALDYAHSRCDSEGNPLNLVHRDVSPRNILISSGGNVRLCDFGVAKAVSSVPRTEIGALKGKLHYMSPEQAAGAPVDARSDVFSLGSVLFEMITGRRLFVGDSEISLLEAVRRGKIDDPQRLRPDLPQDVARILRACLQKSPAKRSQSAGQLARELEEALYRFDAKPSPTVLGEWLAEVFTETSEAGPSLPQSGPEAGDQTAVAGDHMPAAMAGEGSDLDEGRWRFWLGILAGLSLAALTAFVLELVLGRV